MSLSSHESVSVVSTFIKVSIENSELQGEWIPAVYWASLVCQELEGEASITASQLKKALEKRAMLNRDLDCTDGDRTDFRCLHRVLQTTHFVPQRQTSMPLTKQRKKKRDFLCVCKTAKQSDEALEFPMVAKMDTLTQFYKGQYTKYANKIDTMPCPTNQAVTVDTSRAATNLDDTHMRTVTPTNIEDESTEDYFAAADECRTILQTLFTGIINSSVLEQYDLFSIAASKDNLITLRTRIQKLGCAYHKEQVDQHYKQFYGGGDSYDETVASTEIAMLNPLQHPLLTERFKIPMAIPAFHDILQGILKLSTSIPQVLELPKHGGSKGTSKRLLAITSSTTEKSLYLNASRWMPKLLETVVADDESKLSKYHVVSALIRVLLSVDEQAFIDVCRSSRAGLKEQRQLDSMLQKALVHDAHLTQKQFRLIRQYTIVALGYNIFQPESAVKAIDTDVFEATVVPFKEFNRKRMAHFRPIDQLFKWKIDKILNVEADKDKFFNGRCDLDNLKECHIIVGGDHGQGAFRFVATCLLFSKDSIHKFNLVFEDDFLCGFIECKKDTYAALDSTIARPLNESLKRIGEELVILKSNTQKSYFIEWGANNASKHVRSEDPNDRAHIIHTVPVQLFMVGDLAFQLMAQGRESMSSYWCPRCQWGWKQWQCLEAGEGARVGQSWSWHSMNEVISNTRAAEADGKAVSAQSKKGLTQVPLFDAVPVGNYVAPVLHSVDLFVNSAKDLLDAFIDHRLEDRPQELLEARWQEADHKIVERKALEDFNSAKQCCTDAVAIGDSELAAASKAIQADTEKAYKAAKKQYGHTAAEVRKMEKKKLYGAMSQDLRQEIDGLLSELFYILRSSYHGGDYEGNHCRKLIRMADEAMDAIEGLLLAVPLQQRAEGCTNEEVKRYCQAFKRLFQYFDLLSSYCYQPYMSITNSEMEDIKRLGLYMDNLWRKLSKNVPPKVHVWQHLIEDLDRLRGLKSHQESKLETAHQDGVKLDLRFRAMAGGSLEKKIKCSMKYLENMKDPATKAKQEEVKRERARKLGDKSKASKDAKRAEAKRQRQDHKESILELPQIEGELPSMLELAIIDRMERQSSN
jgi:hypothetical protein